MCTPPPATSRRVRTFAATLPAPDIGDLVAEREPLGTGRLHRIPSSRRRHYERLRRFPRGFLVTGDALSSFNPAYGQGMTVAAVEALALRNMLAGPTKDDDLAARFFRKAARIIDVPWGIAGGSDLRLPGVPGPRPIKVRIINSYVARVQAAAAVDPVVGLAFLRVANTVDLPDTLLRPSVALRILRAGRARGPAERARRPGAAQALPFPRPCAAPATEAPAPAAD